MLFVFGCMFLPLAACKAKPRQFYTLEKAYQKGFLSKEDLKTISETMNINEEEIDAEVLKAMKEDFVPYYKKILKIRKSIRPMILH